MISSKNTRTLPVLSNLLSNVTSSMFSTLVTPSSRSSVVLGLTCVSLCPSGCRCHHVPRILRCVRTAKQRC